MTYNVFGGTLNLARPNLPSEFFYSCYTGLGGRWCPIKTESLSRAVFEITGLKDIGITTLTFEGHVTSSMTSSFDPPQAISY